MGHQGFGQQSVEQGIKRFQKHALIGGAIAGVASAIPLLNALNLCFCALVALGSILGVNMYLKDHPGEMLSDSDGATLGGMAGVVAGGISGILNTILGLALASVLAGVYASVPGAAGMIGGSIVGAIVRIPIAMVIMGGMGALYGFLSMQLFFKDRRKQ